MNRHRALPAMNKILEIHPAGGEGTRRDEVDPLTQSTRVIAITSGKGGVGKTNITTNLGIALASRGARVCIFDADTSLANINILMGLTPRHTLEHLLEGEKTLDDIILDGPKGVKIVPAASGIAEYAQLDETRHWRLVEALRSLEERFDYLLIDTAAGVGETVLRFVQSAQRVVVVISPEPTSLTDAFALIRVLKRRGFDRPIHVLVNMVLNYANSMEVFKRFEAAAKKYLHVQVHYLGYIPRDEAVGKAVAQQRPVLLEAPASVASRCFMTLADVLSKQLKEGPGGPVFSEYWRERWQEDRLQGEGAGEEPPAAETQAPKRTSERMPEPSPEPASGKPPAPAAECTPEEAQRILLNWIAAETTTGREAAAFLHPLIEAFEQRFHDLPCDVRQIVTLLSRSPQLNETEFRDLIFTLESHYEKRFQHPLRSLESRMVKLLADIRDSEELGRQLILQLKEQHGPSLCRAIFSTPAEIVGMIRDEELDKETLAFLIEGLSAVYRERYGALPGGHEARAMLENLQSLVQRLDQQEHALEDSLLRLGRFIEESLAGEADSEPPPAPPESPS